jgi:hypothetical protein
VLGRLRELRGRKWGAARIVVVFGHNLSGYDLSGYDLSGEANRSDITEGRPGTPLKLALLRGVQTTDGSGTATDATGCTGTTTLGVRT